MFNLVLKDFIIQKKFFFTAFLYYLIGNLLFVKYPSINFMIIPSIVAYRCVINACSYDYKNNSDILLNSLSINRKDVVYAKYLSTIVFILIGICISIIISFIFSIFGFGHINRLISFKDVLVSCINILLLISIYFPVYFKWGYLESKSISGILELIILGIPSLLIMFPNKMGNLKLIIKYLNFEPNWIITIFIIVILFLIGALSVLFSNKAYINKEF